MQEEEEYKKTDKKFELMDRSLDFVINEGKNRKKKCCKYFIEDDLFTSLEDNVYQYFRNGIVQFKKDVKKIDVQ